VYDLVGLARIRLDLGVQPEQGRSDRTLQQYFVGTARQFLARHELDVD